MERYTQKGLSIIKMDNKLDKIILSSSHPLFKLAGATHYTSHCIVWYENTKQKPFNRVMLWKNEKNRIGLATYRKTKDGREVNVDSEASIDINSLHYLLRNLFYEVEKAMEEGRA